MSKSSKSPGSGTDSETQDSSQTATGDGDVGALAKQYLDLWQEHLRTLSEDPALTETWTKTLEFMNTSAAAFSQASVQAAQHMQQHTAGQGAPSHDQPSPETGPTGPSAASSSGARTSGAKSSGTRTSDPAASGAAAAAAAHDNRDADLDRLARRVDDLERRLAALEAGVEGRAGGSGKKAR